jgi:hypothetical protein
VSEREELIALRRMAELEAKAGVTKTEERPVIKAHTGPLMEAALAASRGLFTGGPLMGLFGESSKQFERTVEKAAYKTGGAVTDMAANVVAPETAAKAGFATNVGIQALPALLGGEMAKSATSLFRPASRTLMQSAVKPTLEQLRTGKAGRAIETMLQEGVGPTQGGLNTMKARIADLNDEISSLIQNSPATVDKKVVAGYLNDAIQKFEKQVTPGSDVKAIQAAWDEFLAHPMLGDKIPVQTAQQLKQGTYKALGDKSFGELKGASVEAQKTLARGLKEEISKAVPEVASLNKREGDIINALKVAERRVLMDANKNPVGLGWLAQPWMIPFWMWDRSPGAKAATARMLYSDQLPANAARAGGGYLMMPSGQPEDRPAPGLLGPRY